MNSPGRTCRHNNVAPAEVIDGLPSSQGGSGRHKCTVCAYALGATTDPATHARWEHCEHGSAAPSGILEDLPDSQSPREGRHRCPVCAFAKGQHDAALTTLIYPDDLHGLESYPEGAKHTVTVNAYERNALARRKCIEHYGYVCAACDTSLEAVYGQAGSQLIHVHHVVPLSQIGKGYDVDPVHDLRPVCPNCHAVIHRRDPAYSIDEVRQMLKK
jgi:hypothetical protein